MPTPRTIAGVFDSETGAEAAKSALLRAGVPYANITLSADLNSDGLTGECPGQSYENQPGQGTDRHARPGLFGALGNDAREQKMARYGEAVRSGVCVVSVDVESSEERRRVEALMREMGARHTGEAPC